MALRRSAGAHGLVAVSAGSAVPFHGTVSADRGGLHERDFRLCFATDRDRRITRLKDYRGQSIQSASTALVFPICNEQVSRVCEGCVRLTVLQQTGLLERFDFYILSDSSDPDKWVEEERRWFDLVHDLDVLGRVIIAGAL